jgi:hypothetical protein
MELVDGEPFDCWARPRTLRRARVSSTTLAFDLRCLSSSKLGRG